jgi:hypothetical protein
MSFNIFGLPPWSLEGSLVWDRNGDLLIANSASSCFTAGNPAGNPDVRKGWPKEVGGAYFITTRQDCEKNEGDAIREGPGISKNRAEEDHKMSGLNLNCRELQMRCGEIYYKTRLLSIKKKRKFF